MHFLNPIWFFGAAATAIPLIIHLWNIRPGRVLKVGSISLIDAASRKSSRSFKLNDILLLILRCLFLLLLVTLLALPYFQQKLAVKRSKGWVLIPKEDFNIGYKAYKKSVDSLLNAGFEFHFFDDSLPKADIIKLLKDTALPATDHLAPAHSDYWALIKQLDNKVTADLPVYLYTSNIINHFKGEKPAADLKLHWQTYAEADSTAQWIENAWFTNNKNVRIVKGISDKYSVNFTYTTLPPVKGNSQFKLYLQNGAAKVSLANKDSNRVTVDTSSLKIAIYTDNFQPDAGYLKAALDAIIGLNQRQVVIKQYSNAALIPAKQTWIFWLSEQPIPARLLQKGVRILAYQQGKQSQTATTIGFGHSAGLPDGNRQVALFKTAGTSPSGTEKTIWHNGYGNPVLWLTMQNGAEVFRLSTHFSPGWNDMVWDGSFPQMILELLNGESKRNFFTHDKRVVDIAQMLPAPTSEKNLITGKFSAKKDLAIYFWIALIAAFFAERWLATSDKFSQSNG